VELEFGPDDDDRFFVASAELMERFGSWLDTRGRPVELRSAEVYRRRWARAREREVLLHRRRRP
jgi:hypothetical protein